MLVLGRALPHRLGGRGAARGCRERGIAARSADEGLRRAVGRLDQAHLALQASQRQHAVLFERGRELLGGDAVDLVPAVGDEVEDEAQLTEFLGEARISSSVMPVVSQLNEGDRLYASILSGNSAWIASANCLASARSAVLVSIQRMSANGAAASDLAIA